MIKKDGQPEQLVAATRIRDLNDVMRAEIQQWHDSPSRTDSHLQEIVRRWYGARFAPLISARYEEAGERYPEDVLLVSLHDLDTGPLQD